MSAQHASEADKYVAKRLKQLQRRWLRKSGPRAKRAAQVSYSFPSAQLVDRAIVAS